MKTLKINFVVLICCLVTNTILANTIKPIQMELLNLVNLKTENNVEAIIKSYVKDYRNDRFASEARIVGIQVPEHGIWTVHVTGKKLESGWEVILKSGLPQKPTYVYRIEYETLQAINNGVINALTAQGKAFSGDYTPMSVSEMEGFKPTIEDDGKLNAFSFHFWTKGFPEVIPFNTETTRRAHGSNFTVFYYEKGLRTAWYRVLPNEKVRHDPREQAMPFPMLIVAIKGVTEGEVGGERVSLSEGNTVFIPPGATHKWWNDTKEASEAILIMFGEGA